jgi:prepilin-type N-terminal cleavage/methylation domain-containing protein
MIKAKENKGFSLLELAIVLVIIGFIFAPLIAIIVQIDLDKKARNNVGRNDRAVAALNFYLKQNGRYPCPAVLLGQAPGDPAFGREAVIAGVCDTTLITDPGGGSNVYIGALPTHALGLPYDAAVNEDGWKHIYVVTQALTREDDFDGVGAIEVEYEAGGANMVEDVHFVIVNPGKDGKGATTLFGDAGLACGASEDSENCDFANEIFLDLAMNTEFDNVNDPNFYDDILSYNSVTQKSDFWVMNDNASDNRIDVINRTQGNVGLGVVNPTRKLDVADVVGGNIRVDGGDVDVQAGMNVTNDVNSANVTVEGTQLTHPNNKIKSKAFTY